MSINFTIASFLTKFEKKEGKFSSERDKKKIPFVDKFYVSPHLQLFVKATQKELKKMSIKACNDLNLLWIFL